MNQSPLSSNITIRHRIGALSVELAVSNLWMGTGRRGRLESTALRNHLIRAAAAVSLQVQSDMGVTNRFERFNHFSGRPFDKKLLHFGGADLNTCQVQRCGRLGVERSRLSFVCASGDQCFDT